MIGCQKPRERNKNRYHPQYIIMMINYSVLTQFDRASAITNDSDLEFLIDDFLFGYFWTYLAVEKCRAAIAFRICNLYNIVQIIRNCIFILFKNNTTTAAAGVGRTIHFTHNKNRWLLSLIFELYLIVITSIRQKFICCSIIMNNIRSRGCNEIAQPQMTNNIKITNKYSKDISMTIRYMSVA